MSDYLLEVKNLTKDLDYSFIPFNERKEMNEFIREEIVGQLIREYDEAKITQLTSLALTKWNKLKNN